MTDTKRRFILTKLDGFEERQAHREELRRAQAAARKPPARETTLLNHLPVASPIRQRLVRELLKGATR